MGKNGDSNGNIEYVPVWRVQVWERKDQKGRKGKAHLIEAELYESEEEAQIKAEEFLEGYKEEDGYVVKMEKDFLKIVKQFKHSIMSSMNIPPI